MSDEACGANRPRLLPDAEGVGPSTPSGAGRSDRPAIVALRWRQHRSLEIPPTGSLRGTRAVSNTSPRGVDAEVEELASGHAHGHVGAGVEEAVFAGRQGPNRHDAIDTGSHFLELDVHDVFRTCAG